MRRVCLPVIQAGAVNNSNFESTPKIPLTPYPSDWGLPNSMNFRCSPFGLGVKHLKIIEFPTFRSGLNFRLFTFYLLLVIKNRWPPKGSHRFIKREQQRKVVSPKTTKLFLKLHHPAAEFTCIPAKVFSSNTFSVEWYIIDVVF